MKKAASFSNINFLIFYHVQKLSFTSYWLFNITYIFYYWLPDFRIPQSTIPNGLSLWQGLSLVPCVGIHVILGEGSPHTEPNVLPYTMKAMGEVPLQPGTKLHQDVQGEGSIYAARMCSKDIGVASLCLQEKIQDSMENKAEKYIPEG